MGKTQPETVYTNVVRAALRHWLPHAVVHKHHADEYAEAGVPDLFGDCDGLYLAWEIKVRPYALAPHQATLLKRYRSPLAGVLYLDDDVSYFVPARELPDKWTYKRNEFHFHIPHHPVPDPAGKLIRLPRVDLLVKFLTTEYRT